MKIRHYVVLAVLTLLWWWLSVYVLLRSGINLKNILVVAAAGWMIIYPVWRRFHSKNAE